MFCQLHLINAQIKMRSGCKIFSYLVGTDNYSTSVETQARIWLHKKSTANCVPFHSQHGQEEWSQGPETQCERCFYLTLERYSFHEEEAKSAIFFDLMTGIKWSLLWSNKLGTTIKRYCSQITPYHNFTIIPKTIKHDSPVSQVLPNHHSHKNSIPHRSRKVRHKMKCL